MNQQTDTFEILIESGFVPGRGRNMEVVNTLVMEIARTDIPVFILGESGTGKEVYARLIYKLSCPGETPLKKLSCATLDPIQLLQEVRNISGTDVSANPTRTLFLDAVDELDPACQRALLAALQDDQGGRRTHPNLMRLICSSLRNLQEDVAKGKFRKELYFRINGVCLPLPPLRERKEDIVEFLQFFLQKHAKEMNKTVPELDQETIDTLIAYEWPGNIRELENFARNMLALGSSQLAASGIRRDWTICPSGTNIGRDLSLKTAAKAASREKERELILQALERNKWNRKRAALELQISYKALLYKLKQIGTSGTGTQR